MNGSYQMWNNVVSLSRQEGVHAYVLVQGQQSILEQDNLS